MGGSGKENDISVLSGLPLTNLISYDVGIADIDALADTRFECLAINDDKFARMCHLSQEQLRFHPL